MSKEFGETFSGDTCWMFPKTPAKSLIEDSMISLSCFLAMGKLTKPTRIVFFCGGAVFQGEMLTRSSITWLRPSFSNTSGASPIVSILTFQLLYLNLVIATMPAESMPICFLKISNKVGGLIACFLRNVGFTNKWKQWSFSSNMFFTKLESTFSFPFSSIFSNF